MEFIYFLSVWGVSITKHTPQMGMNCDYKCIIHCMNNQLVHENHTEKGTRPSSHGDPWFGLPLPSLLEFHSNIELHRDYQVRGGSANHLHNSIKIRKYINQKFALHIQTYREPQCPIDCEESTANYRNTIGHLLSECPELQRAIIIIEWRI